MQSDNARRLDIIVSRIGIQLRKSGYHNSKRIFNRIQPDNIVHIIDFQMGPSWKYSLRGKFTVELGVFVPEIYHALHDRKLSKFIRSFLCAERQRLGILSPDGKDKWWDLKDSEIKQLMNCLVCY